MTPGSEDGEKEVTLGLPRLSAEREGDVAENDDGDEDTVSFCFSPNYLIPEPSS